MRHHANTLVHYFTSEIGTSLQGTKLFSPLFGGSTVYIPKEICKTIVCIWLEGESIQAYIGSSGGVLQVPTGGHAVNLDNWFPMKELGEQTDPHLHVHRERELVLETGVAGWWLRPLNML